MRDSADWQKIAAAAKQEGKLTLYNGTALAMIRVIADHFTASTGIAVDVLEGRATEIFERVRTEQAAGQHLGDVIYNGANTMAASEASGMTVAHGPLPNTKLLAAGFPDDGITLPVSSSFSAFSSATRASARRMRPRPGRTCSTPNGRARS